MARYAGQTILGSNYGGFGRSIAGIGDINGDGFDDFIIGSPFDYAPVPDGLLDPYGYNSYYGGSGRAFVLFGAAEPPFNRVIDADELDGTDGFSVDYVRGGPNTESGIEVREIGHIVAGGADINGDGLDDFVVAGRPDGFTYDYVNTPNGSVRIPHSSVFVVFGRTDYDGRLTLQDLDPSEGFEIEGLRGFVTSLSLADVNGDGFADVVIGQQPPAPYGYYGYYNTASRLPTGEPDFAPYSGFVFFGSETIGSTGPVDTADIDGSNGFAIASEFGNARRGYFGEGGYYYGNGRAISTLESAGDINGDGFEDLIGLRAIPTQQQGYDQYGNYYSREGAETTAFIVFGRPTILFPAVFDLDIYSYEPEILLINAPNFGGFVDTYSSTTVAALGDVNGDGFDDFGVSFPNLFGVSSIAGEITFGNGALYVVYGSAGAADGVDFAQNFGVDGPRLGQGFALGSTSNANTFGAVFEAAGDVNGDGFDDFIVGQPFVNTDPTANYSPDGLAYLILGQADATPFGDIFNITGLAGFETLFVDLAALTASEISQFVYRIDAAPGMRLFGAEVSSAGDVNGDGFDDIAITAPFGNFGSGFSRGSVTIIYGGDALDAIDAADGTRDNIISAANVGADVDTGALPIRLDVVNAGFFTGSVVEGDPGDADLNAAGFREIVFSVRRTGDLTEAVSFDFAVRAPDFFFSGVNAADFRGGVLPTGTVTFADGESVVDVVIEVNPDLAQESSEALEFVISNPVAETSPISIGGATAFSQIFNDDQPAFISVSSSSRAEDDANNISFTIFRFGDTSSVVTVDYRISTDFISPGFAADASDIVGFTNPLVAQVTFAAGETTKVISLDQVADTLIENNEFVRLDITAASSSSVQGVQISNSAAIATIFNDDFAPRIRVLPSFNFIFEGNSGFTPVTFTILREGDVSGALQVEYSLQPSPGFTSFFQADSLDVVGLPSTNNVINFADGESSKTVTVNVVGDTFIEAREFFDLRITSVHSSNGTVFDILNAVSRVQIENDDGRPPVIPPGVEADVFGDPHIVTLDGLGYDFQAVGEYILVETVNASDPNGFQVQVRFEPLPGSDLVSVTTRMAVTVGGRVIEIDANTADSVFIDGVALTAEQIALGAVDVDSDGTADLFINGDEVTIVLNALNEQLKIKVNDGSLNVCVFLDESHQGLVRGLMGDADGDGTRSDDLALRDGTVLSQPLAFDLLYGDYAQSWLLDGTDGKDPAFTDGRTVSFRDDFPAASFTLDDLPQDLVDAAIAAAMAAGITDPILLEAAALDFALTGNNAFLTGALGLAADPEETSDPTDAPALPAAVGVTRDDASVTEGDTGNQTVLFNFYRFGDVDGAVTVSYAIGGTANAADLAAGTALTGTVSFAAGQTSASIGITVLGDFAGEADETLTVSITGLSDEAALVAASSATVSIINDDLPPVAEDDTFTVTAGVVLSGNVLLGNPTFADSDAEGDTLSVLSVTLSNGQVVAAGGPAFRLPSGALFSITAAGAISFDARGAAGTPSAYDALGTGEIGTETLTYVLSDGTGNTDEGTIAINVRGVNDAVIAIDGTATAFEDGPVVEGVLLANDVDANDELVFSLISGPGEGGFNFDADGFFAFAPGAQFQTLGAGASTTVTVTFSVTDGTTTDTGEVVITVNGVNDAPVAGGDVANTDEDTTVTFGVTGNDTDIDAGDVLFVSSIDTTALLGAVTLNGDGTLTYDPNGAFEGLNDGQTATDVFSYTVSDGNGGSSTTTVQINISGITDEEPINEILGTNRKDILIGTDGADRIRSLNGNGDRSVGGAGDDIFVFEANNGRKETDFIRDFRSGEDVIDLADGVSVASTRIVGSSLYLFLSGDNDIIVLTGVRSVSDADFI